ncbi:hypothetical protein [Candidatus Chlorohelix sp.]|uniref:hypothetical protein n=1 Tax=Candidatus Chlorohelix sp. TaxID=3139201 RepID=UPI0030718605
MFDRRERDYLRHKGPTMGCADVTIISIASITAFVILIMVLSRADFSNLVENFGRNSSPIVNTPATTTVSRTTLAIIAPSPTPVPKPVSTATPTPALKKLALLTNCNLRPEPSTTKGTKGEYRPGIVFIILGNVAEAEGIRWINVELDDGSKNQGWMWDVCFNLG